MADGSRHVIMHFTNVSDGTGENLVTKIDASTLSGSPTRLTLLQAWYSLAGMDVDIFYVGAADELVLGLSSTDSGHLDYRMFGGIRPAVTGLTGDIKFTTRNATAGDTYSITLAFKKG